MFPLVYCNFGSSRLYVENSTKQIIYPNECLFISYFVTNIINYNYNKLSSNSGYHVKPLLVPYITRIYTYRVDNGVYSYIIHA